MPFKHSWEKTQATSTLSAEIIRNLSEHALSAKSDIRLQVIEGGSANLNVKLSHKSEVYILRIYLRDPSANKRERALAERLKGLVPIPTVYKVGQAFDYDYTLMQFIEGMPLRDVLINRPNEKWQPALEEAGELLGPLKKISFSSSGFLDEHLNVITVHKTGDLMHHAMACLKNPAATTILGAQQTAALAKWIETHITYQPEVTPAALVHGDYDPANILVKPVKGEWKISALLDWEFAFSGSWLWDLSNMLRDAHKVAPAYQMHFLTGLRRVGITLPETWPQTIRLLNTLSLLDCLVRPDYEKRPRQYANIRELITFFTQPSLTTQ